MAKLVLIGRLGPDLAAEPRQILGASPLTKNGNSFGIIWPRKAKVLRIDLAQAEIQTPPIQVHVPTQIMKSVVIVGAGPSGLVAAKHFLHNSPSKTTSFAITILDSQSRVGGMWALTPDDRYTGKCSPGMRVNGSIFSVVFDDLNWRDVDLKTGELRPQKEEAVSHNDVPLYPKAYEVARYLQAYANKFIPAASIKLNCRVTSAVKESCGDGRSKWKLSWSKTTASGAQPKSESGTFDYLIVASGFFAAAASLRLDAPEEASLKRPRVTHSSKFRSLSDLLPTAPRTPVNIVIAGGGFSGVEAAAEIARQVSSARNSPESLKDPDAWKDIRIYHVFRRPFYPFPRFIAKIERDESGQVLQESLLAPAIIPGDLGIFDYTDDRPQKAFLEPVSEEKAKVSHEVMTTALAGSLSNLELLLPAEILHNDKQKAYPPNFAIDDQYAGFVRSGDIVPVRGVVSQIHKASFLGSGEDCTSGENLLSVVVAHRTSPGRGRNEDDNDQDVEGLWDFNKAGSEQTKVAHVVAVISASGFEPTEAISWLPDDILEVLQYDEHCRRMPLILREHSTGHPSLPDIAFVGFYEGPFWGVMEVQAELLVRKWSLARDENGEKLETNADSAEDGRLKVVRRLMNKKHPSLKQFWMGDHLGVRREIAHELMQRVGSELPNPSDVKEVQIVEQVLQNHVRMQARAEHFLDREVGDDFVRMAVFHSLLGRWKVDRKLATRIPGQPSGHFIGTANFFARAPTDATFDWEYLYSEQGRLTTPDGFEMEASRQYVYRLNHCPPRLSVWFTKDDNLTTDHLFHDLVGWKQVIDVSSDRGGWSAEGDHLCSRDRYLAKYLFQFSGSHVYRFRVIFNVKGPQKDYVSESWYTPISQFRHRGDLPAG